MKTRKKSWSRILNLGCQDLVIASLLSVNMSALLLLTCVCGRICCNCSWELKLEYIENLAILLHLEEICYLCIWSQRNKSQCTLGESACLAVNFVALKQYQCIQVWLCDACWILYDVVAAQHKWPCARVKGLLRTPERLGCDSVSFGTVSSNAVVDLCKNKVQKTDPRRR